MIDSRLVIKEKADGVKDTLCAKDFEHTKKDDLYVPTPSPAIVRTLLTRAHRRVLGHVSDRLSCRHFFTHRLTTTK